MKTALLCSLAALLAAPAAAETLRPLCPDRPGAATPACIVDKGHLQIETGLVDWTHDTTDGVTMTTLSLAGTEMRYGIAEATEIGLTFAPWNSLVTRDAATSHRDRSAGFGDMTLAIRHSFASPDGSGTALALQPFVTIPTAASGVDSGGWTLGLLLPFSLDLGSDFNLGTSAQLSWAPSDGGGHHMVYFGAIGTSHPVGPLQVGAEFSATRDSDVTQCNAGFTLAWTIGTNLQLDGGLMAGLNHDTPATRLYAGISRRF